MNSQCLLPELRCRRVEGSGVQCFSCLLGAKSMNSPQRYRDLRHCLHLCASIVDKVKSPVQHCAGGPWVSVTDCRASQTRPTRPSARWKTVRLGSSGSRSRYAAKLKTMAAATADLLQLGCRTQTSSCFCKQPCVPAQHATGAQATVMCAHASAIVQKQSAAQA